MSSRANNLVEISLDRRQVTGIVSGSLVTLAIVFALGVGFGQRLASAPPPTPTQTGLKQLDARPAAPSLSDTGFTFQQTLLKGDPNAVPPSAPDTQSRTVTVEHRAAKAPPGKPNPNEAAAGSETTAPWKLAPPLPRASTAVTARSQTPPSLAPAKESGAHLVVATAQAPRPPPRPPAAPAPTRTAPALAPTPDGAVAPPARRSAQRFWCVQFGAAPGIAEAEKLAQELVADGYQPFVVTADIPGKGRYYRVRVGRFATPDQANSLRTSAAAKHGLAGLVMPEP